jgi:hypothetical protein
VYNWQKYQLHGIIQINAIYRKQWKLAESGDTIKNYLLHGTIQHIAVTGNKLCSHALEFLQLTAYSSRVSFRWEFELCMFFLHLRSPKSILCQRTNSRNHTAMLFHKLWIVKTSIETDDEMVKVHLRLRKKYKFLIEVDEEMYKYLQLYFKIC